MLNNNGREFELKFRTSETGYVIGELSVVEFETQMLEYLKNERELDKFLIRAMVEFNMGDFGNSFLNKLKKYGIRFNSFYKYRNMTVDGKITDVFVSESDFNKNKNENLQNNHTWVYIRNIDLSLLDISNITDLSNTFAFLNNFNQDISNWNVSNVTNMSNLFLNCKYFNQDINNWNVSKVESMESVFYGASKFNKSLNNWNVSSAKSFFQMFHDAHDFNQSLDKWDTSNCTDFSFMFENAINFNQDINVWELKVKNNIFESDNIFYNAKSFKQYLGDWALSHLVINGIKFDEHNERYQFTEYRLNLYIDKFNNDKSDQNKYELIKYMKQYSQAKPDELKEILYTINDIGI
jgi:surface protein